MFNIIEDGALKAYHNEPLTESDKELFADEFDIPSLSQGKLVLKSSIVVDKSQDEIEFEGGDKNKPSLCARICCKKGGKDDGNSEN